jgi:hypothetical protein
MKGLNSAFDDPSGDLKQAIPAYDKRFHQIKAYSGRGSRTSLKRSKPSIRLNRSGRKAKRSSKPHQQKKGPSNSKPISTV